MTSSTALAPLTLPGLDLPVGACGLTGRVDEQSALQALVQLRKAGAAWRWIVGDLVLAIADQHPDGMPHALQLIADLDLDDRPSLMKSVAVAQRVPLARRRPGLTWSHHLAVLAGGPDGPVQEADDRDRWLDAAANGDWTVGELERRIAEATQDPLPLGEGEATRPFRLPAATLAAVAAILRRNPTARVVLSMDGTVEALGEGD